MRDHDRLEEVARSVLPPEAYAFVRDAAGDGVTARANEAAFERRMLIPRVLADVREVDPSCTLLGIRYAAPVGIAPLPRMHRIHPDAELGLGRAAASVDLPFCAATNSSVALEELADAGGRPWFQLYPHPDVGITRDLMARAVASGYHAVVVTVDRPVAGAKASETSKATDPATLPNLALYGADAVARRHHPGLTWDDLSALTAACEVPVVAKGVLHRADAVRAVEVGCAAVWVSNHGGRQLDTVVASLDALGPIVDAVGDAAEVVLDSGVRTARDVLVARALGARACFVGRPAAYALAAGGSPDVQEHLERFVGDLERSMALLGAADLAAVTRDRVA